MSKRRPDVAYRNAAEFATGLSKVVIDQWASQVANWCGFKIGHPVAEVVERLGGRVHFAESLESPDGGTIFIHAPGDFDVLLSTWTSPNRDQFTLAHELGHYFLHSQLGKRPLVASRSGNDRSEWEANWFAAGFLMPEEAVKKHALAGASTSSLAQLFNVSFKAMEIRRQILGV